MSLGQALNLGQSWSSDSCELGPGFGEKRYVHTCACMYVHTGVYCVYMHMCVCVCVACMCVCAGGGVIKEGPLSTWSPQMFPKSLFSVHHPPTWENKALSS